MGFLSLGKKGQISIEIIMLVMVIALFIQTVINPSLEISTASAKEVTRIGQARYAAEKLANTIDAVSIAPGENKRTITLFVPEKSIISCKNAAIAASCDERVCFQVALDETLLNIASTPSACIGSGDIDGDDSKCAKSIDLLDGDSVICQNIFINNSDNEAGVTVSVEVESDGTTTLVSLA